MGAIYFLSLRPQQNTAWWPPLCRHCTVVLSMPLLEEHHCLEKLSHFPVILGIHNLLLYILQRTNLRFYQISVFILGTNFYVLLLLACIASSQASENSCRPVVVWGCFPSSPLINHTLLCRPMNAPQREDELSAGAAWTGFPCSDTTARTAVLLWGGGAVRQVLYSTTGMQTESSEGEM